MVTVVCGDPANPFLKENPQFRYFGIIKEIQEAGLDPERLMWSLWILEDPSSPYYGMETDDRIDKAIEAYGEEVPEGFIDNIDVFRNKYVDELMCSSMRRYRRLDRIYDQSITDAYRGQQEYNKAIELLEEIEAEYDATSDEKKKSVLAKIVEQMQVVAKLGAKTLDKSEKVVASSGKSSDNLEKMRQVGESEWKELYNKRLEEEKAKKRERTESTSRTLSTQAAPGLLAGAAMDKQNPLKSINK